MKNQMAKMEDQWQTRDDVDKLMRADEVHSDSKRLKRAADHIHRLSSRLKKHAGRSKGRSGGR